MQSLSKLWKQKLKNIICVVYWKLEKQIPFLDMNNLLRIVKFHYMFINCNWKAIAWFHALQMHHVDHSINVIKIPWGGGGGRGGESLKVTFLCRSQLSYSIFQKKHIAAAFKATRDNNLSKYDFPGSRKEERRQQLSKYTIVRKALI